jgi:predicted RNA polymerase sigma factor
MAIPEGDEWRFVWVPRDDGAWMAAAARHSNIDREDPP